LNNIFTKHKQSLRKKTKTKTKKAHTKREKQTNKKQNKTKKLCVIIGESKPDLRTTMKWAVKAKSSFNS